jgi:glycosidase
MRKIAATLLTFSLLFGSVTGALAKGEPHTAAQAADSKLGVYYELYVNSFYDSNHDGHGDLNGIIQKLDYLNDGNPHDKDKDLGVNALWLMPIFPSPSYHKYDTTDFYSVDPQYGNLEDFRRLTQAAHQRGMKVILDIALNHTSNQHPWFQAAMKDKNSPYRDYYIWADKNTDIHETGPWGQQLWKETYPGSGDYYYALFADFMPDLNYDNPKVREEMIKIGQFWLKQGADGFRLDAAMHIYTGEPDKNVAWWSQFRQGLEQVKPDVYLVGEVWDRPYNIAPYFKSLDSSFNFDLSGKILDAVKTGTDTGVASFAQSCLALYQQNNTNAIDAPFLTNHDQERVMSELSGDTNKAKMAASILLTMPGNPYIYYGEEIGMLGNKPDEYLREPFRWYPGNGEGQTTWEAPRDNVGTDAVSVAAEDKDKNSLLNHYRELIHVRQASDALMKGGIAEVRTGDSRVLGYTRTYQDDSMVALHNLSQETVTIELTGAEYQKRKIDFSTSKNEKLKRTDKGIELTIPPYTTLLLK